MRRMLLTGASGGLGRHLLRHLQQLPEVELYTTHRSLTNEIPRVFQCDFLQPGRIRQVLTTIQPDVIVHLAADFGDNFASAHAVNFFAAMEILDWVKDTSSTARVLLLGSAAEYGLISPAENPISESRVLAPVSMYGMTKACQSQLVSLYAGRGVDVLCARLFNLRGAGLSERMFVGRVAQQIKEIKAGQRSEIEIGPLGACRDFIDMSGAIAQLMAILQRGARGQIYHVGSGKPITMRQVLAEELAANDLDFDLVREAPSHSNRAGFDVPIIYANIDKTLALLQASPPQWQSGSDD